LSILREWLHFLTAIAEIKKQELNSKIEFLHEEHAEESNCVLNETGRMGNTKIGYTF
jgi:hypothetical protein